MSTATGPQTLVREVCRQLGLRGRSFCRFVHGRSSDYWIIHHGSPPPSWLDDDADARRFTRRCRLALSRAGLNTKRTLFQAASRIGFDKLVAQAQIEADRMPQREAKVLGRRVWVPIKYNSDRIEMWNKSLQRSGDLFRVVRGDWISVHSDKGYSEEVVYVGGRRGADPVYASA